MEHPITWALIANSNTAYIYDLTHKENLNKLGNHLVQHLGDPLARLKSSDLGSDEVGRYRSEGGPTSTFSPDTDPHQAEVQHFAHLINDFLVKEHAKNHYKNLIVCAEPRFIGILEGIFAKQVKASITKNIHKDYIPLLKESMNSFVEHFEKNL